MARGMSLDDKYIYSVVFDNDRLSDWRPKFTYAYGPYMSLAAAKRMLNQEEGTWSQSNGRIMRTEVKWEELEGASLKSTSGN